MTKIRHELFWCVEANSDVDKRLRELDEKSILDFQLSTSNNLKIELEKRLNFGENENLEVTTEVIFE